jgi:phage-related protein
MRWLKTVCGYVRTDIAYTMADKPLVWLSGEVKTPAFSALARLEAGVLLRRLQRGESLGIPHSRPMPRLGRRCHEPRIPDESHTWRVMYRIDADAIVIGEVFSKKTAQTPESVLDMCRRRFRRYDEVAGD